MRNFLYYLSVVTFTMTLVLFGLLTYWLYYPFVVITIENDRSVPVNTQEYRVGDRIEYQLRYCKKLPLVGTIHRAIVNGTRTAFTTIQASLPLGCHTANIAELTIPTYFDPDVYHIETTVEYTLNPLRTERVTWRSVDFRVIH